MVDTPISNRSLRSLEASLRLGLLWYRHIIRMEERSMPKRPFRYQPENRQRGSRPRLKWIQGIETAMRARTLEKDDAQNRRLWKMRCGMQQKP
ncbi:hypothetical protein ILUMI_09877 [Ignelater luminosus]|uniref:Uncharacterized protein n=1 Tax=Ignelater luminosus TaxID=2038154 RepID=A0A8K0D3E8_IGNLU|nr:hypothetical protein ILUMI_09877 [Ignelater luminosus]